MEGLDDVEIDSCYLHLPAGGTVPTLTIESWWGGAVDTPLLDALLPPACQLGGLRLTGCAVDLAEPCCGLATATELTLRECFADSPSELLQLAGRVTALRSLTIDGSGFDDGGLDDHPAEPAELDLQPITGLARLTRLALHLPEVQHLPPGPYLAGEPRWLDCSQPGFLQNPCALPRPV